MIYKNHNNLSKIKPVKMKSFCRKYVQIVKHKKDDSFSPDEKLSPFALFQTKCCGGVVCKGYVSYLAVGAYGVVTLEGVDYSVAF